MQILSGSILSNALGLVLLALILREARKENVPIKTLLLLVITGALIMLPVIALQTAAGYAGEIPLIKNHPLLQEIVMTAIRLAFIEELCKFMGTKIVTWKGAYFTDPCQGPLFPAIVGLSFGILESALYMALSRQQFRGQFWLIVLLRAFVGAPAHGAYGVIMGIFYGRARDARQQNDGPACRRYLSLAVLLPSCIHGVYNWLSTSRIIKIGDTLIVTGLILLADILIILQAYRILYRSRKTAKL
ncbi:MAG: PrsW family glutamic-type intramembrane protease [Lachnospiraceae bacterium]|nr:PrsW family glutamic-type intramembrane protease [Lachnospiraceae bacterium]